jgi:hypothetical protein
VFSSGLGVHQAMDLALPAIQSSFNSSAVLARQLLPRVDFTLHLESKIQSTSQHLWNGRLITVLQFQNRLERASQIQSRDSVINFNEMMELQMLVVSHAKRNVNYVRVSCGHLDAL